MNAVKLGLSGAGGTIALLLGELHNKGQESSVFSIRNSLASFFGINNLTEIAIGTIVVFLALGAAMCFIFEDKTLDKAFYRGASVLAIIMSLTPSQDYKPLKTTPNSVLVSVSITTADNKPLAEVYVTVWNIETNTVFGRSKFVGNNFSFYQPEGRYRVDIEAEGYYVASEEFEVREGQDPRKLTINMALSNVPLFIQKILR